MNKTLSDIGTHHIQSTLFGGYQTGFATFRTSAGGMFLTCFGDQKSQKHRLPGQCAFWEIHGNFQDQTREIWEQKRQKI